MANVPPPGQEELDKEIGVRIQKAMCYKDFTDDELAKIINVNRVNITRYRNGQRQCPTSILVKIANACDVTTDFLLGITEYPYRDETLQSVPEKTGLSAEAIQVLQEWKSAEDIKNIFGSMVSVFLESYEAEELLQAISELLGYSLSDRKGYMNPLLPDNYWKELKMARAWKVSTIFAKIIDDLCIVKENTEKGE